MYTAEQLRRKTQVIDANYIDELAKKYVREDDDDSMKDANEDDDEDNGESGNGLGFFDEEQLAEMDANEKEVGRNGLLPSI